MKTYVICGALQGIGLETMIYFANKGCNIIACAHKSSPEFDSICNKLQIDNKITITKLFSDFNDFESIKNIVNDIRKLKVIINGVVSLVGVTNDANFQMVKKDDLIKTYNINVVSNLYFIQLLSKILIRQCTGSILFVSSISALDGNEGQLSYSCSKGALVSATKTLSKELGSKNIRVNCIAPGVINTTMNEVVPKNIIEDKISTTSLKRIGQPIEVASTIYFLLSEESSFITGQVIRIDGGM